MFVYIAIVTPQKQTSKVFSQQDDAAVAALRNFSGQLWIKDDDKKVNNPT